MFGSRSLLLLVGACQAAPSSTNAPITNVAPAKPAPVKVAPTCTETGSMIKATIVEDAVVACYLVTAKDSNDADCWRFQPSNKSWSFASRHPRTRLEDPIAPVTATPTAARVCKPDGTDCRTVPLSGVALDPKDPEDALAGATNADRTIIAVWAHAGAIHVFDMTGKRLAKIAPWAAGMNGTDPSWFRAVHVLGNVLEVRIADTPISSAIRLYDARTGKQIADVAGGKPMDDTAEPGELGGTRYGFLTLDTRDLLVVDVATGKQLASHPLGDVPLSYAMIGRTRDGIVGVVGSTAFVVDGSGKVSTVEAPNCPRPE